MADEYRNFAALAAKKQEGKHYRVSKSKRPSPFLVAAPHGGRIEPNTSVLARAIAGVSHSLYVFESIVPKLHITSSRFDEPRALEMATAHRTVVTVHGCDDARSPTVDVFVGGLDRPLRDRIIKELNAAGFQSAIDNVTTGRSECNLCNKGTGRTGAQLEITRRLRRRLSGMIGTAGAARRRAFASAVRRAFA